MLLSSLNLNIHPQICIFLLWKASTSYCWLAIRINIQRGSILGISCSIVWKVEALSCSWTFIVQCVEWFWHLFRGVRGKKSGLKWNHHIWESINQTDELKLVTKREKITHSHLIHWQRRLLVSVFTYQVEKI